MTSHTDNLYDFLNSPLNPSSIPNIIESQPIISKVHLQKTLTLFSKLAILLFLISGASRDYPNNDVLSNSIDGNSNLELLTIDSNTIDIHITQNKQSDASLSQDKDVYIGSSRVHKPPSILNTHVMDTRSKKCIFKPKAFNVFFILPIPNNVRKACKTFKVERGNAERI